MIGIFDSGIGGITVLNKILPLFPNYKYIYYSDSKNNPYGSKSKEELLKITKNIISYLISQGCQIIIIGCNTASTICYDDLIKNFSIPIIKIEPPSKISGKTLVLATAATVNSKRFKEISKQYDNQNVFICACPGLADMIEDKREEDILEYLKKHLLKYKGVENVILGCTHYPLIKDKIKQVLGNVNFYDGSEEVINNLKLQIGNTKETSFHLKFIDTSHSEKKKERFFKNLNI